MFSPLNPIWRAKIFNFSHRRYRLSSIGVNEAMLPKVFSNRQLAADYSCLPEHAVLRAAIKICCDTTRLIGNHFNA